MADAPAPVGRRAPYTAHGIRRVPCQRCGAPSAYQWQVCSNGNRYLGCCEACDIALNRLALRFFRFPDWRERLAAYVRSRVR